MPTSRSRVIAAALSAFLALAAACAARTSDPAAAAPGPVPPAAPAPVASPPPAAKAAPAPSPTMARLQVLTRERQEKLYYDDATLPVAVKSLTKDDLDVQDMITCFKNSTDDMVQFNLVLILGAKLEAKTLNPADRAAALSFLTACLGQAHPWIKTEAVYALGNARDAAALPAIQRCFDDPNPTVVFHAVIAFQAISGKQAVMTAAQMQTCAAAQMAAAPGQEGLNALSDRELASYRSTLSY